MLTSRLRETFFHHEDSQEGEQAAMRVVWFPVLEIFKPGLDKAQSSLVWHESWSCSEQEGGLETSWGLFQPGLAWDHTRSYYITARFKSPTHTHELQPEYWSNLSILFLMNKHSKHICLQKVIQCFQAWRFSITFTVSKVVTNLVCFSAIDLTSLRTTLIRDHLLTL